MRKTFCFIAKLVCSGQACRLHKAFARIEDDAHVEQQRQFRPAEDFPSSKALASILLAYAPPPSWETVGAARGHAHAKSSVQWRHVPPRLIDSMQNVKAFTGTNVSLHDPVTRRTMQCKIIEITSIGDRLYASMAPLDTPAVIIAEDDMMPLEDEAHVSAIFPSAARACTKMGFTLKHTPMLTVVGEPSYDESEMEDVDSEDEDDGEDNEDEFVEVLLEFREDEKQYFVGKVLDPMIIVGRQISDSSFEILNESEIEQLEAMSGDFEPDLHSEKDISEGLSKMQAETAKTLDVHQHALNLRDKGFTVLQFAGLDKLIPAARQECERELQHHFDDIERLGVDPTEQAYSFNEICHRSRHRWDVRASSTNINSLCLAAITQVEQIICMLHNLPVHPGEGPNKFARSLSPRKPKPVLMGTIISRPGAAAQPLHRDASERHLRVASRVPTHRLFNIFVPLVDVAQDGVGTQFWPGSHLAQSGLEMEFQAIERSGTVEDDAEAAASLEAPACPAGGIILFDFRTVHRGLPNVGNASRPYAYAICGTGWASETHNFPEKRLQAELASLPMEQSAREAAMHSYRNSLPFWDDPDLDEVFAQ